VAIPDPLRSDATRSAIGVWGAWGGALQDAEGCGLELRPLGADVERSVGQAQGAREPVAPVLPTRSGTKRAEPERGKPDEARSAARSCAEEALPAVEEPSEEPVALRRAEGGQPAQTPPPAEPELAASPGELEASADVRAPPEASEALEEPRPVRSLPGQQVAGLPSAPRAEVALAERREVWPRGQPGPLRPEAG